MELTCVLSSAELLKVCRRSSLAAGNRPQRPLRRPPRTVSRGWFLVEKKPIRSEVLRRSESHFRGLSGYAAGHLECSSARQENQSDSEASGQIACSSIEYASTVADSPVALSPFSCAELAGISPSLVCRLNFPAGPRCAQCHKVEVHSSWLQSGKKDVGCLLPSRSALFGLSRAI